MAKHQDEKMRQRRRLQDQAIELASKSQWDEAVEVNQQIVELGEDADAFNRLGKAFFELGRLNDAREAYQNALRIMPSNLIAKRNVERLEDLIARHGDENRIDRTGRQLVDLRLFIAETGKTALTTLMDVQRAVANTLVTGEQVQLKIEGQYVLILNSHGEIIGRLEPKVAQRLSELMNGGNRYIAAVAQANGNQIRVLIRETFQHPSQRNRVSFPGKFSEGALRGYYPTGSYEDYGEDLLDEEDSGDEPEEIEEEVFSHEEEELGLDDIEPDMGDDEDMNEE
ncbi:MAG TPA: tetratricopeptide repeat protein [Roseiflexaceae bacterium]|nr:tetratricopeptide repeat protein [Roseiflexaceae bacterium]